MAIRANVGCRADSVSRFLLFVGLGLGALGLSFASGCSSEPAGTAFQAPTGTGGQPDCTPATWKDPGTVPNPTAELVAADSGKGVFPASTWDKIADFGYLEEEYFITGTSPAYTSRIVVHRPKDAAKFTGTV